MATMHQPGVREIVSDLARAILGTSIQQLLDTPPSVATHQWFVHALVGDAVQSKSPVYRRFLRIW